MIPIDVGHAFEVVYPFVRDKKSGQGRRARDVEGDAMRNMSFALTTDQVRARTKTVTRRTGWASLKPGTLIQPVVKGMGLKPGEKVQKIGAPIRVVSVRRERLDLMTSDTEYGFEECKREGFGDHRELMWPSCFVAFFCASHKIPDTRPWGLPKRRRVSFPMLPCDEVTRIEFEYTDDERETSDPL